MKKIVLLGAGGHSKVLIETILSCNKNYEIVLLDDKFSSNKSIKILGYPIIGKLKKIFDIDFQKKYKEALVSLGDSSLRIKWINTLLQLRYDVPSFIHSTAYFSSYSSIGSGSVVFAKAVVQSDVKLGKGVILNSNSIIEHDGLVGDGSHICPGVSIAGSVKIGKLSFIGIGASIKQDIYIGDNVVVGAGSVVLRNIDDHKVAFGVPAKIKDK